MLNKVEIATTNIKTSVINLDKIQDDMFIAFTAE